MSLPQPGPAEPMAHFVARCHGNEEMIRAHPNGHDRRHAAQRIWAEAQAQHETYLNQPDDEPVTPSPPHPITPSPPDD